MMMELLILKCPIRTKEIYSFSRRILLLRDQNLLLIIQQQNEKELFVEFKDEGIGIKKEHLKSIFEKFYRVPTGNVHDVKGFGLGLYYVKLIIEAHRGDISVKSTLGVGTSITIRLPFS